MNIVFLVFFLLFPAVIVWLNNRVAIINKVGIILVCYITGVIIGNTGIIPESFSGIQTTLQDVSVCLALPLVLFSLDVKKWLQVARKGILSMLFAVISIAIVVFALNFVFGKLGHDTAQYSAMAMGLYTGGTPNIAAIKTAIGVDENTFTLFNTYDIVLSLFYIVFITTFARPVFQKVFKLKPFEGDMSGGWGDGDDSAINLESYKGMFTAPVLKRLIPAVLLSAVILGISYVLGTLVSGYETAVTILCITTMGIACSFIRPVRETKMTTQAGMYIIYIFCFTVASMADLSTLVNIDWVVLIFILVAVFGSLTLHVLFSRMAGIDSDTVIITSASAICSPPFVPVVCASLKNNGVLISGLATGIIGYAIGNYLGIATYLLLS